MKLPMPTAQEIYNITDRAEQTIYMCSANRAATRHIVENAIRSALALVTEKMNIQIPDALYLDLGKN